MCRQGNVLGPPVKSQLGAVSSSATVILRKECWLPHTFAIVLLIQSVRNSPYGHIRMVYGLQSSCLHTKSPCFTSQRASPARVANLVRQQTQRLHTIRHSRQLCCKASHQQQSTSDLSPVMATGTVMWLLSQLPAQAEGTDFSQGSFSKESYYVTLGLFLLSVPGKDYAKQQLFFAAVVQSPQATRDNIVNWLLVPQASGRRLSVLLRLRGCARHLRRKDPSRKVPCRWISVQGKYLLTSRNTIMMSRMLVMSLGSPVTTKLVGVKQLR